MNVRYETCLNLPPDPLFTTLLDLLIGVFSNQSRLDIAGKLAYQQAQTPVLALLALSEERVIGCKIGHERKPGQFYSWLGCVDPAYRGQGIAVELMRQQHEWCRQNGYHTIRTQTYNQWRDMLVLNIRAGFDIIGTLQTKRGLTIVLEKAL